MPALAPGRIALLNPLTTIGVTLAAGTYDGTDATSYTSTSFTPAAGSTGPRTSAVSTRESYGPTHSLGWWTGRNRRAGSAQRTA